MDIEAEVLDLVVRPAAVADLAELAEVYIATRRAAVPAMPAPVPADAEIRAWMTAFTLGPDGREVWVAVLPTTVSDGERVVGYALLKKDWLDSLYVLPRYAGRGIGSTLLDVVKSLRPGGFDLWVFVSNVRAQAFYRRAGLVVLEQTDGSGNEERSPDLHLHWAGQP